MRPLRLTALCVLVLASTGCMVGSPDLGAEFDVVSWDMRPLEFETDAELRIGSSLIGLASMAASWSDDPDARFAADLLEGVETVHVGSYTMHGRRTDAPDDLTRAAREELRDLGWLFVVRTRNGDDESAWVLARTRRGETELLVVSIDDDELTLVKVEGHPDRLLDAAVRRDGDFAVLTRTVGDEF